MNLNLTIRTEGGAAVIRIGAPRLVYAALESFLEQAGPCLERDRPLVVLDFEEVNYVDSAAIGCLMDLYRRASSREGVLAASCLMGRVERMLRMTGAHEFIPLYGTVGEALAAVSASAGQAR